MRHCPRGCSTEGMAFSKSEDYPHLSFSARSSTQRHLLANRCQYLYQIRHMTFTFMHLADTFIQSDLQLHSGYTFSLICVFPGNRTHNFLHCWRNALPLSHTFIQFRDIFAQLTLGLHCCASVSLAPICSSAQEMFRGEVFWPPLPVSLSWHVFLSWAGSVRRGKL